MKNIKTALTKPSPNKRLWALWIWNKKITETEMVKQLNSFIDNGFGGVAIRASRDIAPAYLSREFFRLFELALYIAKEKNIGIRIADDFSLPWSDFFQPLAEQNEQYRAQLLSLQHRVLITAKETFQYHLEEDKSKYVILAVKVENGKINPLQVKNVLSAQKGADISWKNPAGDWHILVLKKIWYRGPRDYFVPNVFNPKVVTAYTQSVLELFTARFSKFIPSTLEGFICEMPCYLPSNNSIPWDDDLIIKYRSRYKKNLLTILPSLFLDVDDRFAKYRSHVYNFIFQAMYDRFPAFLESWAKKHRVSQWVLCPERTIHRSDNALKDVTALPVAPLSATGIQNHEGTEKNYALIRAMADMNTLEYKRETIGVIGRNIQLASSTLQSLKTEIDQHAACGVSKILLDGCFFNLDQRSYIKTPFNPAWYHPEWNEMKSLCEYTARLLSMTHDITRSSPVAVVAPVSSIAADYLPGNDEIQKKSLLTFRRVIEVLSASNVEFDVISEQFLNTCTIRQNGEFGPATKSKRSPYLAVIFPYSRLISNSTFVFLEKLAIKKGTILFVNEAPLGNFDDGQSTSFSARVARLTRPKNENVHIAPVADIVSKLGRFEQSFRVTSGGKPATDIRIVSGFGHEYNLWILQNDSAKKDCFCTCEFPDAAHVYSADCRSGELFEILKKHTSSDGLSYFELNFAPKQTHIIMTSSSKMVVSDKKNDVKHPINMYETVNRNYRVVLKDRWLFSPDSYNSLPLANWNTRIGLSRDSGGYSHYYEAYFETIEPPEICVLAFCGQTDISKLIKDMVNDFEVSVNGIVVKPHTPKPAGQAGETADPTGAFCGVDTIKYDVTDAVMKGINRVSIRTVGIINDPGTIVYPPVIAGHFSIKKSLRGWTIDSPKTEATFGSWTKHGFPYLSGSGTYEQVFEVPSDYHRIVLRFNQVSGCIFPEVNSTRFGPIQWQPAALDITDAIEPRRNVIRVRVFNTIDNLLRMNGRSSGLISEAFLDVY